MHPVFRTAAILTLSLMPIAAAASDSAVHDLADPGELELYRSLVGKIKPKPGPESELVKALAPPTPGAKPAGDSVPPAINLLGISTEDGSQVATTAIVVPSADTLTTNLTLFLLEADGTTIKVGTASSDDDTPIIYTLGPAATKDSGPVDAIAQVHVIFKTGGVDNYYQNITGAVFPTSVTSLAPIITQDATLNKWIQICIDRATPSNAKPPGCNYVFGSVPKPPGALVPLKGSVKYPGAIDVGPRGKPKNAEAMLVLLDGDASGPCRYVDLGARFLADPDTRATGDTLSWSIDPALFAASCPDSSAFYTFALAVKVEIAGKPSWATISNAVTGSTKTTIAIPRLQIVAGCIATGTLVTLANGSTAAIETLKVGDKLKSQNYDLTLAAIAKGNENRIVTVSTDGGEQITLSLIQPVITARGVVQARDLRLDDVLTTASGTTKVVKLVQEVLSAPIEVYDPVLTPPLGSEQQGWTLFAGNLLVGDGAMKAALKRSAEQAQ